MPKIVDSMMKVFKRGERKTSSTREVKSSKRDRASLLDADSFIFMPGESGGQFWGEILNDENFPSSQLEDISSRRKTHIGFVHSDEYDSNGVKGVNLIIRANLPEKDDNLILNGKIFNRRLSGTLVKANKSTDEVEDGPLIRDYAFVLSNKDRLSQDISGHTCVYDRLVRPPLKPSQPEWEYPTERKSSPLVSHQRTMHEKDAMFEKSGPRSSTPSKENDTASRGNQRHFICIKDDDHSSRGGESLRPPSRHTLNSLGYSNLELMKARSIAGSEYAMPADAVNWEVELEGVKRDLDQYEMITMREYRTISPQDLMLGDKIGEGQFGDVHSGFLYPSTIDEIEVAIKTCKPDASHEDRTKFLEEASVMCKFKHPNIIKLFGVVSRMDLSYIVMELAPHGQLRRYLLTEGSLITHLMLLDYIAQLSSAMVHLEDMNYVHRDIAARNILVCNPQTIKLADFGLSRGLEDGDYYVASRGKLPIKWMAPESINFRRFTGLSDVWMFGVCAWEILMRGVKPFVGIKNDEVISKIEMGERLALPVECPAPLYALMNMCWKYDPLERPRFVEIEASIREIIEEEAQLEQVTNRRFNSIPIQRDPDAPAKPTRDFTAGVVPGMVRVPSNSSTGKMSSSNSHTTEGGGLSDHGTDNMRDNTNLPPLPPRANERFRELSSSPPSLRDGGSPVLSSRRPVPQQPQPYGHYPPNRDGHQPNNHSAVHPSHQIPPYSVTTISSSDESPSKVQPHPSEIGGYRHNSHIPPPAILSHHPNHQSRESEDIYYSTPSEVIERKQQRVLTKDGVFVSQDVTSLSSLGNGNPGVRPQLGEGRPISHASTEDSSGRSSPAVYNERRHPNAEQAESGFTISDEDDVLKHVTGVVKSVKELSDRVHKSKPNDYIELVKNVGLALRDLLGKVDEALTGLPQETHSEVVMAQKVLSSDMNHLVSAMKDAQTHYDKFLEQEYQKKMLKAAHVVAVNSKLLLDAMTSAKRKAHLMQ